MSTGNYEDQVLNVGKSVLKSVQLCTYIRGYWHSQSCTIVTVMLLGQLHDTVIDSISLKVGQMNLSQLCSISLHFLTFKRSLLIIMNSMNLLEEFNNDCKNFSIFLAHSRNSY